MTPATLVAKDEAIRRGLKKAEGQFWKLSGAAGVLNSCGRFE
jgi:hypothetical protein